MFDWLYSQQRIRTVFSNPEHAHIKYFFGIYCAQHAYHVQMTCFLTVPHVLTLYSIM